MPFFVLSGYEADSAAKTITKLSILQTPAVQETASIDVPYMGYIAHLPEAVFNSLRSGIILSDLAQIVEELICNSLDAGATKVQAFVDVGACYIKVEDDGCGIKRDDLALLGERHATSKLHTLAELNAGIQTLGFRGEALSSLSDVALLEVSTKARGSPNSYRKIIKGCKCLSLGLGGGKQSSGTTVIARDIFYNQPVRRRQFQLSPKKVLQSIRERVLRIALIHPQVSFTVTDVDREEELIHTLPATTPLCILSDIFGNELSSSLHQIDFAKGKFRLSGFLSRPSHRLSSKAVQYFYINSRFVHKTRVHKLLNSSATRIDSSLPPSDGDSLEIKEGKKKLCKGSGERQLYPAYVLNLSCPLSSYDITSELSKTMVEFKDWEPVISFVDEVLQHTWGGISAHSLQGGIAKSRPKKHKIWQHIDPTYHPSCKIEASRPSKEDNALPAQEQCYKRRRRKVSEEAFRDIAHMPRQQRNEDTLSSGSLLENMPRIGCDTVWCQLQQTHGGTGINFSPEQMNRFCLGEAHIAESRQDKENNEILGIEWANPAPGINLGFPSERESPTSELISDLFHFDDKEAQSSVLPSSSREGSVLSKHSPLRRMSSATWPPAINYKKLLSGEVDSFEWKNGESVAFHEVYHATKFDTCRDDTCCLPKHRSPVRVSSTSLSPVICDKSPVSRKLHSVKCKNNEISNYGEIDLPRKVDFLDVIGAEECLENNDSISEGICQSMDAYPSRFTKFRAFSILEHRNPNEEDNSERDGAVSLDHETGSYSFMGKCDQKAKKIERTCFSTNLSNFGGDSGHNLCLDSASSHRSKFMTDVEVGGFLERQKKTQMYDCQPDAYLPKHVKHFDSTGYWIDHPCRTELGEVVPTVIHYGQLQAYSQAELGLRHDTKLESTKFCNDFPKGVRRRSLSAPPFYRRHTKFGLHINPPWSLSTVKRKEKRDYGCKTPVVQNDVEDLRQTVPGGESFQASDFQSGLLPFLRDCQEGGQSHRDIHKETQVVGPFEQSNPLLLLDSISSLQGNEVSLSKWITDVPPFSLPESVTESLGDLPVASRLRDWKNSRVRHDFQDDILDISSGPLYLANSSLVPESISKDCFKKARVLRQLDKKFIAIIAQGNLALIDQHAADERIRLEQLRKVVLEGEGRQKVTYLEHEEELVLPVGGLQLLQSYSEQIENWGWHCKILSRNEESLKSRKGYQLHRRTCKAVLSAVPCILGVNLTAKDLSEYLEQLAQTDGSSAAPPAVLRILSFKACRGAIMFGDSLLQSECSQLVEELKRTALCFQCAHGRPTTVPLVNLETLQRQLEKFGEAIQGSERLLDRSKTANINTAPNPSGCWHGLQWHRATLERAKMRLHQAHRNQFDP